MTRDEFIYKFGDLAGDLSLKVIKEGLRLLNSGAINLESYENNYALPRIVFCAVLEKIRDDMLPRNRKDIAEIKNLRHF